MRIATFNCNSVRRRLEPILAWLEQQQPDVLALQETKVVDRDFPGAAFAEAGWQVACRGEKSYNGVAVVSRRQADEISFGLGDGDGGESETRLAHLRFGDLHLINTYVPQGQALESPKFQFKLAWLGRLRAYLDGRLDAARDRVVWLGDLNVAPTELDVHSPKTIWPHVCYCQAAIDAFQQVVDWGFEDVFRRHLPGPGVFTFWDYRVPNAVQRNLGWRIDHVLATPALAAASTGCFVDRQARLQDNPSDHTLVVADFDI